LAQTYSLTQVKWQICKLLKPDKGQSWARYSIKWMLTIVWLTTEFYFLSGTPSTIDIHIFLLFRRCTFKNRENVEDCWVQECVEACNFLFFINVPCWGHTPTYTVPQMSSPYVPALHFETCLQPAHFWSTTHVSGKEASSISHA
jgi:hypothetical protein